KVRRIARRIDASSPPEEFHDLRKKCGHLRYALEPLADLYGRPARRMVKRLKELQDRLGEQQDLVLFEERLREIAATEDLPARMIFTMGSLASGLARRAAELRAGISGSKALRAVRKGRGWEKLRKAMEERPPEKDTG
ncbi:MAG: CHAD domain-containing protein, partial [Actinomycetota bacterium]